MSLCVHVLNSETNYGGFLNTATLLPGSVHGHVWRDLAMTTAFTS